MGVDQNYGQDMSIVHSALAPDNQVSNKIDTLLSPIKRLIAQIASEQFEAQQKMTYLFSFFEIFLLSDYRVRF